MRDERVRLAALKLLSKRQRYTLNAFFIVFISIPIQLGTFYMLFEAYTSWTSILGY